MIEDWSCITTQDTTPYAEICREAVEDNKVFAKFKQDPRYTAILEHVSPEHGGRYIERIMEYELNDAMIDEFKDNDDLGGANRVDYGEPFGKVSPSTLRYITNALDISYFFGEGELNKIVEIGGGYGGLCKVMSSFIKFDQYLLLDLEECNLLSRKYLSHFSLPTISHRAEEIDEIDENFDLLISNYALSECDRETQMMYIEKFVKKSNKFYVMHNNFHADNGNMSYNEFIDMLTC